MMVPLKFALSLLYFLHEFTDAVRPAFENDPGKCKFTNRPMLNGVPSEMTPKTPKAKYFRRLNETRDIVTLDKAMSICRMYDLEAAEILDQDDYNEVIKIVQETGWSFWIAVKGRHNPEFGNFNFDFTLTDGFTKIGFHDFAAEGFDLATSQMFEKLQEGCVAVIPNMASPSGVSWTKVACNEVYDILCQYKKSCYKKSDYIKDPTRPIKRLIPMNNELGESAGYYISTLQATWPFAKQVCEDEGLSLFWFEDENERTFFQNLINEFENRNPNYEGKSFWTAGRFSPVPPNTEIYEKLYWWKGNTAYEVTSWDLSLARSGQAEFSGGFNKKWGNEREATHLDKNEPYDEGLRGRERCVDAAFTDYSSNAEYFTSKCEKSLRYFICKNSEVVRQVLDPTKTISPSLVEYCAGGIFHKSWEKDCTGEIIFAGQTKPECTCYSGVHGLMADNKCKPRLLVGTGCTKLKAKASLHWKILPASVVNQGKPWIIAVHNDGDSDNVYNWFTVNVGESSERQILGTATFYFYGFDLHRNSEPGSREICFVMKDKSDEVDVLETEVEGNQTKKEAPAGADEFYEYHVDDVVSLRMRYFNYPDADCALEKVPEDMLTVHHKSNEKNDCQLEGCTRSETPTGKSDAVLGKEASEEDEGNPESLDTTPIPGFTTTEKNCEDEGCTLDETTQDKGEDSNLLDKMGKAEGDIEDVNDNINRQLLIYAIESAFPHFIGDGSGSSASGGKNSWLILEKLFELAKLTCQDMVKEEFLSRVLKYFKITHFGENYAYGEYFSDPEMKQISTLLDSCHERVKSVKEMHVQVDRCSGKAWRVTLENKTREVISRSNDDTGYQSVFHHHILEAAWDVIDLWNALCVNEFRSSYLLYHHMERGMETLFTDKLRKLWHFPNVTEDYFQKLLGPDEGIQIINLDQCVQAAYKGNSRINRMGRPNRGRNTVVGQMIRSRLEDEKLKSQGVPPSRNTHNVIGTGGADTNKVVATACIRGSNVRCNKRGSNKGKKSKNFVKILQDIQKVA